MRTGRGDWDYTARIELSTKVVDDLGMSFWDGWVVESRRGGVNDFSNVPFQSGG